MRTTVVSIGGCCSHSNRLSSERWVVNGGGVGSVEWGRWKKISNVWYPPLLLLLYKIHYPVIVRVRVRARERWVLRLASAVSSGQQLQWWWGECCCLERRPDIKLPPAASTSFVLSSYAEPAACRRSRSEWLWLYIFVIVATPRRSAHRL